MKAKFIEMDNYIRIVIPKENDYPLKSLTVISQNVRALDSLVEQAAHFNLNLRIDPREAAKIVSFLNYQW